MLLLCNLRDSDHGKHGVPCIPVNDAGLCCSRPIENKRYQECENSVGKKARWWEFGKFDMTA